MISDKFPIIDSFKEWNTAVRMGKKDYHADQNFADTDCERKGECHAYWTRREAGKAVRTPQGNPEQARLLRYPGEGKSDRPQGASSVGRAEGSK
ncbi:hypothetical protein [[Kitasatospora] papulosa]|uniref:hypothetical protein n=1 Tax=[Kitasatospora] papulosa TaxID=1464011 RepID=UPI00382AF3C7